MSIEMPLVDKRRAEIALDLTRRMRYADISRAGKAYSFGQDTAGLVPLSDAQRLVTDSAKLIVSYVTDLSRVDQRDQLDETLDEMREKYEGFPKLTKFDVQVELGVELMKSDVTALEDDWKGAVVDFYYGRNKNRPMGERLLTQDVGIVTPLSTDYHRAMVHRTYIKEKVGSECFDVIPVSVDTTNEVVIFPQDEGLSDKWRLGFYIDIPGEGDTSRLVNRAIDEVYPDQSAFAPPKSKVSKRFSR